MSDPLVGQLLLQIVLIGINGFFAATEIAVLSLNANKLKRQAEQGDKHAGRLLKIVNEPSGFLSSIQVGITFAGFLASAFAADNFSDRIVTWLIDDLKVTGISAETINTFSVIIITMILSYFTLVFGELVPKRIAMQKTYNTAKNNTKLMHGFSIVMKPIIWFLTVSTNGVLRLLKLKTKAEEEEVTEDEIKFMIDVGEEKGTINAMEKKMIDNIFEFNNTYAKDIMTHRVDLVMINLEDDNDEIIHTIEDSSYSRIPVYDDDIDNIVGILNVKDYLLKLRKTAVVDVNDIMRPAYFVPETILCDALFRDMQASNSAMAVVVDEFGALSGVVTMEDLLESIVGEIYDEYDISEEQEITKLENNLWRVAGSTEIEMLEEKLDITLPEDAEYDTLGGLVFSHLNTIPKDGSKLTIDVFGLNIHVDEIKDHRVEWAYIRKL
ncbi:MAG: hemolysin family protein [Clostridia bacterium]